VQTQSHRFKLKIEKYYFALKFSNTERKNKFLTTTVQRKLCKPSLFQVLLLDNNPSQDVEVQEAEQVDFGVVKEHLRNGGSVFITSKDTQKIQYPKTKAQTNYSRSRRTLGSLFHRNLRS
jgi:hypothetical protein